MGGHDCSTPLKGGPVAASLIISFSTITSIKKNSYPISSSQDLSNITLDVIYASLKTPYPSCLLRNVDEKVPKMDWNFLIFLCFR